MITKHFLNGTEVRPENAELIGIRADWTSNPSEAELSVDRIVLVGDARKMVLDHIYNGAGLFEGMPYDIEVDGYTLNYFIDFTDNVQISDDQIECKIVRRKAKDWFKTEADGLSFELLATKTSLTYIDVPYLIVKDNQLEVGIMLSLTIYSLTKELIQSIKDLVAMVTAPTIQATTPNASVPPSLDTGDIIALVLKVSAQVAYTIAIIIALIDLITQLMELIFPKIRYFKASTVKHLIEKGCEYLGYGFSSTLLEEYKHLTILPVPLKKTNKSIFNFEFALLNSSYTKGHPTAMDTVPTLGALIDAICEQLYGQFRVIGTTLHIERERYWYNNSGVTVINTVNIQDRRVASYTYNFGDMWKRKFIKYLTDPSDIHTYDNFEATDCEYSSELITSVNPDLSLLKGLQAINIPFAMGARKNSLTFIEKQAEKLAKLADTIVNTFGGNSNLAGKVQGRIGVLMISQQYYSVTKLLWIVNGKQPSNYLSIIGANAIYEANHVASEVNNNLRKVYQAEVPFSQAKFINLLEDNVLIDQDGEELEVLSYEFLNESSTATITYMVASEEASNVKTILING